jgi:ribosomal protein S18 acetylase RimI-like enzyme
MSNIRLAHPNDLPALADLWLNKAVLLAQTDTRFTLASEAAAQWSASAAQWITDARCRLLVAEESEIVGFITGWMYAMPPGVLPVRIGVVTELVLDMHFYQQGAARALISELKAWFRQQGIDHIAALVPHRHPVQQAFWRSQGAAEWIDILWLK